MNSIMQEASSLAKAVEQAWIKAGKPQKFSIRVFEDAEKNFLGISTKPAKIALLFEKEDIAVKGDSEPRKKEARPQSYTQPSAQSSYASEGAAKDKQQRRQETPRKQESQQTSYVSKGMAKTTPTHEQEAGKLRSSGQQAQQKPLQQPRLATPGTTQPQHEDLVIDQEGKTKIFWTDEMIDIANSWVHDALEKMDKKDIKFSTEVKRYHLKFSFSKSLSDDSEKQKNLFRNYAYLIMQTVRNRLKKQLKYHKIVLTSDN